MKTIPLEDNFADVLSKARRGLGLEVSAAASQAGVSAEAAAAAFEGTFDEPTVRALAKVLDLHPDRLAALGRGDYRPLEISPLKGFEGFNTAFDDMTVNSYIVWDSVARKAVAFDTGSDCSGILETLKQYDLTLDLILLTHSHGDHIYDLDRLKEKTGAPAWIGEREPVGGAKPFAPGHSFTVGELVIETRSTWGHSPGGITYLVKGLQVPLAVVGDALFAGSMGGGGVSYEAALGTNRANIFSMSDDTVLCPGHGPLTTVGEQKRVNPFYPEF